MLKTRSTRSRISTVSLLIAAYAILAAGCAKIAEPQPPEILIPKPATDLRVQQRSAHIEIAVSKPELNTDGSPATTLQKVEVFRLVENASAGGEQPLPEKEFAKQATRILTIPAARFSEFLHDKTFVFQDNAPAPAGAENPPRIRYAVRFVNNKNQSAGLSNQAMIAPIAIPSPPEELLAEVTEDCLKLKWKAPAENMDGSKPARIAGYNVYRSEEPEKTPSTKLNAEPSQNTEYEDRSIEFDTTYYYAVSTVGSLKDPYAESLPSKVYPVVTRDTFPPAPPSSFDAMREDDSVLLLWSPSSSKDVAGYKIYRSDKGSRTRRILQTELVTGISFRDKTAEPGNSWVYSIQAVDTHGNESAAVKTEVEGR